MSGSATLLFAIAWKSSLLVLLAWTALRLVRPLSAASRHIVWVLLVIQLLALPILEMSLPRYESQSLADVLASFATLMRGDDAAQANGQTDPESWLARLAQLGIFDDDEKAPDSLRSSVSAWQASFAVWTSIVWMAGVCVLAMRTAATYRAAHHLTLRARPVPWFHGVPAPVRVLESAEISSPFAVGILRPVVLFPVTAAQWSTGRRTAALAHEIAHLRRRDPPVQLAIEAARTLYWFNPLVWFALRRLEVDREFACDDAVIAAGLDAGEYADALLASARDAWGRPVRNALGIAHPSQLSARCKALFDTRVPRLSSPLWKFGVGVAGSLALAPLVALTPAPSVSTAVAAVPTHPAVSANRKPPESVLSDPRSELVPADYATLLQTAAAVPAGGKDQALLAALKAQLARTPRGYADLVRERATWCLSQAREGSLVDLLLEKLSDADWRVRAYAAWCLGRSGDVRVIQPLKSFLVDDNWRIRAMGIHALAAVGGEELVPEMTTGLRDSAWQVRIVAVEYFNRHGHPDARAFLRPLLDDVHTGVRTAATEAYDRLGQPRI